MRVLIACEFSGITRDAFTLLGHKAMSCDFEASERPGWHYQGDVRHVLDMGWDLMIAHPDCTYLTLAGARWFLDPRPKYAGRRELQKKAIAFFQELQHAPIEKICIENPQPLGVVMDRVGRYTQKVQPWQHGEPQSKGLCLWLKGLPPLVPTVILPKEDRRQVVWRMAPGPERQKDRSRSFAGVARDMAAQWGTTTDSSQNNHHTRVSE